MTLIALILEQNREARFDQCRLLGQYLPKSFTGCLYYLLLFVFLYLKQDSEQLVAVLGLMCLEEAEAPLILRELCHIFDFLNDWDVKSNGESENLDPCHLPQVASLLFVIHAHHHSQGILVDRDQLSPAVEQAPDYF